METTAIEKAEKNGIVQSFDLTSSNLPNLQEAREVPADLTSEYWTPEEPGESKLCFYQRIEQSTYTDQNTGEEIQLPCAIFIEQREDLSLITIRNGSVRLVAALEESEKQGQIFSGTPMKVTFTGKKQNKTNSKMSDRWSIRPLSA